MNRGHPALPPETAWPWIVGAGAVWLASWSADLGLPGLTVGAALASAAFITGHRVIGSLVIAGYVSTLIGLTPVEPPVSGEVSFVGSTAGDVITGEFGPWVLVDSDSGTYLVEVPEESGSLARASTVAVTGVAVGDPGTAGTTRYRAVVSAVRIDLLERPTGLNAAGNAVRGGVLSRLEPFDRGRALLAGFLIGDTSRLDEVDVEAMRLAGISHFTAVSGSNVALYLMLVYLATGPLSWSPSGRAVVGLAALPIYVAATGFEPSVLRASVMAALLLTGRIAGVSLDAWQVLAASVTGLLIVEPAIGLSPGFQLSVAATAGVMVGSRWPVGGGWLRRTLAVSVGAQVAVAPLLLAHFGTLPVSAPLANLVAAPLVSLATVLGAVGVTVVPFLVPVAAGAADLVLSMAQALAGWPQIGWLPACAVAALGWIAVRSPRWRPPLALGGATALVLVVLLPGSSLAPNSVVVLDVGQGDAILLSGGDGHVALVDTGPDPVVMLDKLRAYGIRSIDLLVLTHPHLDHIGGATAILGRVALGRVWADPVLHATDLSTDLFDDMAVRGLVVTSPVPGSTATIGGLSLTVLGPERRYADPNDQSIVLLVEGPAASMLLAGDAEVAEQLEIGPVEADVLKVPHHGGATSDPGWLSSVGAGLAVISVGDNDFGHPAASVVSLLESTGARVVRTDIEGDIVVPLG